MDPITWSGKLAADVNTKNDNSFRKISGIIEGSRANLSDISDNTPIKSITISFYIHSDYNGYFSTTTRFNGQTKTYATGKFSGNKLLTYTFDVDTNVGVIKTNPPYNLEFKAYRASGQGTLKVYCKTKPVTITYYTDAVPITIEFPLAGNTFKQYTENFNITLKQSVIDASKIYWVEGKYDNQSEIFKSSDDFDYSAFEDGIYTLKKNGILENWGPFNQEGNITLTCYSRTGGEQIDPIGKVTEATTKIEIEKNDIFAISSFISRYNLRVGGNNEYEESFDGEYVIVKVDVTTLAESFLDKNIIFTFSAVDDDTTDENNPKSVNIEIENLQKVFSISNLFKKEETSIGSYFKFSSDKNYTVSLIATDNNISIFEQNILISPATPILNVDEGGVAIGKFSTGTSENPKFECAYPAVFQYFEGPVEAGIWIDGKTIYRKIISFGSININAIGVYNIGIKYNKIDNVIKFYGGCKRGSGVWGPLDYSAINTTSNVSIYITPSSENIDDNTTAEIRVEVGSGSTIEKGVLILEYTLKDENE